MELVKVRPVPFHGQPEVVERPFSMSPDPRFVYRSRSFRRTLDEIFRALGRREGLVVVTGEPGTGKTTLCRTLRQELAQVRGGGAAGLGLVLLISMLIALRRPRRDSELQRRLAAADQKLRELSRPQSGRL